MRRRGNPQALERATTKLFSERTPAEQINARRGDLLAFGLCPHRVSSHRIAAQLAMALQAGASLQVSPHLRHRHGASLANAHISKLAVRQSSKPAALGLGRTQVLRPALLEWRSQFSNSDSVFARRSEGAKRRAGSDGIVASAATAGVASASEGSESSKKAWEGVKPLPFVLSVGVGLALRYLVPKPDAVTTQAWQLLAIFASTITGLVLSPLPVGAWAFLGLTVSVITKTLTFGAAFGAFTNDVIWLIVISFFFARGFVKTGLGDRIATYFVKWLGKSTLGLSYGLSLSETLLAPAMPSTTARAGGVFLPIISSLSLSAGSKPNDKSASKLGAYLVATQFQVNLSEVLFFVRSQERDESLWASEE